MLRVSVNAMCVSVTGADRDESHCTSVLKIGCDAIRGEPEMCIFAIGLAQPIGKCVGRDKRTGRFISLTRRLVIGAYTEVEPIELERRPNPRKAPASAARLVVGVVLVIVTAIAPRATGAAKIAAVLVPAEARAARWAAGYIDREFVQQRRLALTFAPCAVFLVWLAFR